MPSQNQRSFLHILIAIPVIAIIAGAFALSIAAVLENLRFVKATHQILEIVGSVRAVVAEQKTFAQNPGEDIWFDLERVGRIPSSGTHPNPWGAEVQAVSVANVAMRIESDMPSHDCRRMALYFLNQSPELGLLAIEAQGTNSLIWAPIYPLPEGAHGHIEEAACGTTPNSRLAVVFRIR